MHDLVDECVECGRRIVSIECGEVERGFSFGRDRGIEFEFFSSRRFQRREDGRVSNDHETVLRDSVRSNLVDDVTVTFSFGFREGEPETVDLVHDDVEGRRVLTKLSREGQNDFGVRVRCEQ